MSLPPPPFRPPPPCQYAGTSKLDSASALHSANANPFMNFCNLKIAFFRHIRVFGKVRRRLW